MFVETKTRIESELEVKAYIQDLKFALNNGAKINFQVKRLVDENRDEKYTNQYTVNTLFPDENPTDALKRELLTLSAEDYMRTVKDLRFPKRREMREFGKTQKSHSLRRCFRIGRIRRCFHGSENHKKRKMFMHMLHGRA